MNDWPNIQGLALVLAGLVTLAALLIRAILTAPELEATRDGFLDEHDMAKEQR